MSFEKSKSRSFRIVGGHDIQFCPYCGETLSEAVDHEISEENRNNIHTITSNCPEEKEQCNSERLFCPRCGEDISTENLIQNSKHGIIIRREGATITCPFERSPFDLTLIQTKSEEP